MLYIYHSNNMELLKTLVIEIMKSDPLEGIFTQEKILVQSTGISQWLKLSIANELGISANIRFPLPATFLWEMFNLVIPNLKKDSAFSKDLIKWKVMTLLPSVINNDEFRPIKNYLENDATGIKNHQLADKIADLYDQYSVFRPEWIAQWETGNWDKNIVGHHAWQPILWKMLVDHSANQGESPYHRANMYNKFINLVNLGDFPKDQLPKRLFVVGISSLPPRFLDAIEALSKHTDIHLMFSNPCRYYWGDIKDRKYLAKLEAKRRKKLIIKDHKAVESGENPLLKSNLGDQLALKHSIGNTLLSSMGKTGRDYLHLLSDKQAHEIDAFVDIERDSLLHCIQSDILNLEDKFDDAIFDTNHHKSIIKNGDHSLSLHGCYSPLREVQVLHDYLLKRFNDAPHLSPADIVVMVSDIDKYTPHINSIFGGAPYNRHIPYSISDRTASAEAPILQAFLDLLSINSTRQEATKIMEILEIPSVMRKFGLDDNGLNTLKIWIEQSGVRWGLDQKTNESNHLPELSSNNWLFGLNRMIMGYAIPKENGEFSEILPYNESQGSAAELAGKLGMFIDALIDLRNLLEKSYEIGRWVIVINHLIDTFFDSSLEDDKALTTIRDKVTTLYTTITTAKYDKCLSSEVVFRHFHSIFSKDRMSQHFMMGKVTFCTLMPMRSIPFNTVCLLGMNDGAYPRANQPEGFDLMSANPIIGDRSRRNDDRYLFLEAILSAQESLYISYISKKIQDNSTKSPSILVSELMEYIQRGYCFLSNLNTSMEAAEKNTIDQLYFEHSLTPFNPEAFKGQFQSYASEWVPASLSAMKSAPSMDAVFLQNPLESSFLTESDTHTEQQLELEELLRFWNMPIKHFFTQRLKVNFDFQSGLPEDEEVFDLTPLSSFPIKRTWLEALVNTNDAIALEEGLSDKIFSHILKEYSLSGELPHGGFAKACLTDFRTDIENLAIAILEYTAGSPIDLRIEIPFQLNDAKLILCGWSRKVYENGAVYYRSGKLRPQDILQAWIQHLSLCAMGYQYTTRILCIDKKFSFKLIDKDSAKALLEDLIKGYKKGMCTPLPFIPHTSYAGIRHGYCKKNNTFSDTLTESDDHIISSMDMIFSGGFDSQGESSSPYISRVWPEFTQELAKEVYKSGIAYLAPALLAIEER